MLQTTQKRHTQGVTTRTVGMVNNALLIKFDIGRVNDLSLSQMLRSWQEGKIKGSLEMKAYGRNTEAFQNQTLQAFIDDAMRYDRHQHTCNKIRLWKHQGEFCIAYDVRR